MLFIFKLKHIYSVNGIVFWNMEYLMLMYYYFFYYIIYIKKIIKY